MRELIGADWLIYQDIQDLIDSCSEGNQEITEYDCSVFTGEYVTRDVDQNYLARVDALRNDLTLSRRQATHQEGNVVGLHNEAS